MWETIHLIVQTIVIPVGIAIAVWQLYLANKVRSLDAFETISDKIKEQKRDRIFIYTHCEVKAPKRKALEYLNEISIKQKGFVKRKIAKRKYLGNEENKIPPTITKFLDEGEEPYYLSVDQAKRVENVCVTFDRMGVFVIERLIPQKVAFSMYFDVVLRTWCLVEPFIQNERKRRENDLWMMYFEKLSSKCWRYWIQLYYSKEWKYMEKPEDLFKYGPTPYPFPSEENQE